MFIRVTFFPPRLHEMCYEFMYKLVRFVLASVMNARKVADDAHVIILKIQKKNAVSRKSMFSLSFNCHLYEEQQLLPYDFYHHCFKVKTKNKSTDMKNMAHK